MQFHNIIYKLLNNSIYLKIFSILENDPQGMSGRALAELTEVSVYKMHHALKFLTEQGVLSFTPVGASHLYRLQSDHILVQKVLNPLIVFQENIFLQLGKDVMKELDPLPLSIILYGSVARGEERPNSDLDILLVYKNQESIATGSEEELHYLGEQFNKIIKKYGNLLMMKRCEVSELKNEKNQNAELFKKILKEGRVIYGLSKRELLNYG